VAVLLTTDLRAIDSCAMADEETDGFEKDTNAPLYVHYLSFYRPKGAWC